MTAIVPTHAGGATLVLDDSQILFWDGSPKILQFSKSFPSTQAGSWQKGRCNFGLILKFLCHEHTMRK